ncbi:MAG: ARMT1-like domain-containing protein [Spirochaetia bacterium]
MHAEQSPSPIRTTESNWFASNTMHSRLPKNIYNIIESNPDLSPADARRLEALAEAIARNEVIPELTPPAPDYDDWMEQFQSHSGERWHDTEWFFGETYAFRLILEACRYWEHNRDPFFYIKQKELEAGVAFEPVRNFSDVQAYDPVAPRESLVRALHASTWGNRSDLSFSAGGELDREAGDAGLLIVNDDTVIADELLDTHAPVHIVMDNSGAELAGDLILTLELIRHGLDVVLHVKLHPTYVSDTTVADFHHFLETAAGSDDPRVHRYGRALRDAFEAARITLAPDSFWCSTRFMTDMPARIEHALGRAGMVIFKGDFNYRRVMRDTPWPADTPASAATGGLDLPAVALLRTMKSDVTWGISHKTAADLDAEDSTWRINGRRGLIQRLS